MFSHLGKQKPTYFQDQFVLADTNADGYVDYDELSAIVGISKRHIAKVHLGNYDKDGDAKLSLDGKS